MCGIQGEVLRAGGEVVVKWLQEIYNMVWSRDSNPWMGKTFNSGLPTMKMRQGLQVSGVEDRRPSLTYGFLP